MCVEKYMYHIFIYHFLSLFRHLYSQISRFDKNGFKPFCDQTLHINIYPIINIYILYCHFRRTFPLFQREFVGEFLFSYDGAILEDTCILHSDLSPKWFKWIRRYCHDFGLSIIVLLTLVELKRASGESE